MARYIAYNAILAWTSEHTRSDSQFYEISEGLDHKDGWCADNEQHRSTLQSAFREIDNILRKKFAVIQKNNPKEYKRRVNKVLKYEKQIAKLNKFNDEKGR